MTNDAKLGMLVGVLGVVVAASLFAQPTPPSASEPPKPATAAVPVSTTVAAPTAVIAAEPPREAPVLASTPVVRTRKEPAAQTASRLSDAEEP